MVRPFELQPGEQKYVATLNIDVDYTIEGSNVLIGSETLSFQKVWREL